MCRLYGFTANEPTQVECSLVSAQNALRVQSDRDGRGRRNADGWGIATWAGERVDVARSAHPAFADRRFADHASASRSRGTVAHVRAATVGSVLIDNTHPFTYGPWAFAHNGTLPGHQELRPALLEEALGVPSGSTDSELMFRWILGKMATHGLDPGQRASEPEALLDLVADSVLELIRRSIETSSEPPGLNLLLSDGVNLAASRWGNSLYWLERDAVRDCAVCGTNHCPTADEEYRAVVVASEPITGEPWMEVQEGTVIAAAPGREVRTRDLMQKAA